MRVLWLKTELLHPLDKGGRLRTYHTLRHLMREHEVHYLTLGDPEELAGKSVAHEYCHTLEIIEHRMPGRRSARFWTGAAGNLLSPRPYAIDRYRSRVMLDRVRRLDREGAIDLVVSDFLVSSQNVPNDLSVPSVLFQHNVEAELWRRHAAGATAE